MVRFADIFVTLNFLNYIWQRLKDTAIQAVRFIAVSVVLSGGYLGIKKRKKDSKERREIRLKFVQVLTRLVKVIGRSLLSREAHASFL